ncbi:ABC transporter ATP-binding protein [Pseudoroseicyclus sp. CLL3-39]|uniref:ABC transporter ATP-binding protein n=1 Tax=Pseudoroseicyclus tamaricis TaxID=2705421 RepID=A0A6B2JTQ6_9RHOB|nr:ABC transporter ATP-binding protein [Pseudoroseicyclus tamaricis]
MRDVRKSYPGGAEILAGVSLDLADGESLALTGESGSGKSTLMHLAAGLDVPDAGTVTLAGENTATLGEAGRAALRRGTVGLVFQQFNLIPSLDAGANIAFHARLVGRPDPDFAARLAERLGLTPHLSKYPEELSGGQQQRVAIARTLAARPALILADEPTGNLDEASAGEVLALLLELAAESGAALLTVTHSPRVASAMSRRLHLTGGRITPPPP